MEVKYAHDWEKMSNLDHKLVEEKKPNVIVFEQTVVDHLAMKGWYRAICEQCKSIFFSKRQNVNNCAKCTPTLEFLQYSKRKNPLTHTALRDQTREFFSSGEYNLLHPVPMIPTHGNTLFSVAGVQVFNPHIFSAAGVVGDSAFVLQPAIRLQGMEDTTEHPGCSTAFVNTVTLQAQPTLANHLQHLNTWLEYIAAIGINIKDLRASLRFQIQNWGTGNCINCNIDIAYGGLDIFNASFFQQMPTLAGSTIDISDMGITIERTLWAINKTPTYFDVIGPYDLSLEGKYIILDAVRTMVLMYASTVDPNAKDGVHRMRAQKARAFAKKSAVLGQAINLSTVVDYFYDYWNSYMSLPVDRKTVQEIIQHEYSRARNIHMAEAIGKPINTHHINTTTDQYIAFLLANGVAREKIVAILCRSDITKKPKV